MPNRGIGVLHEKKWWNWAIEALGEGGIAVIAGLKIEELQISRIAESGICIAPNHLGGSEASTRIIWAVRRRPPEQF